MVPPTDGRFARTAAPSGAGPVAPARRPDATEPPAPDTPHTPTLSPSLARSLSRSLSRSPADVAVRAISVQQPWAFAIARGGKTVSNQPAPTAYRGGLFVHASMRVDLGACDSPLVLAAGWDASDPLATIGAVIATAELAGVCTAAPSGGPCDCGPWADPGSHHWLLDRIRPLPRPVVALGRTGLWEPHPSLVADVLRLVSGPGSGPAAAGR